MNSGVNGPESTVPLTSIQAAIKGTAQYSARSLSCSQSAVADRVAVGFSESRATSRVAHRFGSDKLYICLSNKCFNCIQHICCVTDIRPNRITRSYVNAINK